MSKNKWFYDSLEKERLAYDEGNCTLSTILVESFKRWDGLLQENEDDLQKLSSGRRSIRRRSRDILKAISKKLGPEVLLLCTSVTTIDKLALLDPSGLIFALQKWWDAASHPRLLAEATNAIREAYPLISRLRSLPAKESDGLAVVASDENSEPNYARSLYYRGVDVLGEPCAPHSVTCR
ncbi:hypothetical protein BU26DRAFT_506558 [Trematosphaeria pertusa]|uniref:Uncharacterized protein n=1 Tax=Trematosphaeria pertusa TaxID=390896 RepID=A0A6A6I9P2_9PLEO|nr:uncharacterized protein BU26DRAFT_506558 [Trematosphaeria pertusa]KAF2247294.1 hypothetical protein BU26DRAFT_506558 [Trematosphaeria pertusa]